VTVVWGDEARAYVREQVAKMSPLQAQRWVAKLEKAASRLETFPYSGGILPEVPGLAARQIFVLQHRLIYFVGDEEVTIVTVRHTRESITEHPEPRPLSAVADDDD
jgi:plasmid stabilization system protein ParE